MHPIAGGVVSLVAVAALAVGCESTFFLSDGTITTQNARMLDHPRISSPIVGGTGAYDGAGGTHMIPDEDSGKRARCS